MVLAIVFLFFVDDTNVTTLGVSSGNTGGLYRPLPDQFGKCYIRLGDEGYTRL